MSHLRATGWVVIYLSFVGAILLSLIPLPSWAIDFRPDWLLLVVCYWIMVLPDRVGIFTAWILGLLSDSLNGTLLGEHALVFALVAYAMAKMQRRIRLSPMSMQMLVIFIFLLIMHLLLFWIQGIAGQQVSTLWFWGSAFIGALLWPWIFMVLTDCVRRYKLH